jgi:hypothetical protein
MKTHSARILNWHLIDICFLSIHSCNELRVHILRTAEMQLLSNFATTLRECPKEFQRCSKVVTSAVKWNQCLNPYYFVSPFKRSKFSCWFPFIHRWSDFLHSFSSSLSSYLSVNFHWIPAIAYTSFVCRQVTHFSALSLSLPSHASVPILHSSLWAKCGWFLGGKRGNRLFSGEATNYIIKFQHDSGTSLLPFSFLLSRFLFFLIFPALCV